MGTQIQIIVKVLILLVFEDKLATARFSSARTNCGQDT